ncbi:hypothetical protein [Amycolatopsis orientalis]|uniref:hypothetical protein n=1 Tax=Amycolatopsis orientalis TaxID=31958 RepID=UPI00131A030F|nr:hypothetical protein [Amycolatopsis orientalis]
MKATDFEPRCDAWEGVQKEARSAWESTVRRLAREELLRCQANCRLTGVCVGEWHYRLDAFNAAYGRVPPNLSLAC